MTVREAQQPVRVILIDDHPTIRDGLHLLLDDEQYVIAGEAESIAEAKALIKITSADLVLLDLSLGEESGLELIGTLREAGMLVLVFSMYEDAKTIKRAMDAGAQGYVTKRASTDTLLLAIKELLSGRQYLGPRAAKSMEQAANVAQPDKTTLTQRQEEVLAQVARGLSYKDVALVLEISETTVKFHMKEIIERLQLENKAQAIAYYIRESGTAYRTPSAHT